jgi:hypothetical protein
MRVECSRILNAITGEPEERSPWLTIGRTYTVLEVSCPAGREPLLRLMADDGGTPSLHAAIQFKVVSEDLPPSWGAHIRADGSILLSPREWGPGFWERFFDGDPETVESFRRIVMQMEGAG